MTLPEAFDRELHKAIHARSVWLPGRPWQLGQVLVRKKGEFKQLAHISAFGVTASKLAHHDISLDLKTSLVKQRLFQAGVELPDTANLDLSAEAKVKFEFTGDSQFVLKTPTLSGESIQNMLEIATKLAGLSNWKHDSYFIIEEIYAAADWSFLGTKKKGVAFELSGKGAGILSFLTAGASFGLKTSGTIDVKLLGQGGAIGMNVVRIKKDGTTRYDL